MTIAPRPYEHEPLPCLCTPYFSDKDPTMKCAFSYPRPSCPKSMRDNRNYTGPYAGHSVPGSETWPSGGAKAL